MCPQQLDQFFWAERVRYLAVGSVLERSLFVGREPAPAEPPDPLVCQAAAAVLSALTPQVGPHFEKQSVDGAYRRQQERCVLLRSWGLSKGLWIRQKMSAGSLYADESAET